jgi:lipopolysaccharide exporter
VPKLSEFGKRATKSIVTLTSRTFLLNVINFLGAFALTIFLSPSDFGVFIVASAIIDILTYFSDIGLAGALIQKKAKVKDREIHATFTIQMSLVLAGIGIALIFGKPIQGFYNLNQDGSWLFYSFLAAFFFSSLKTIPSVISERKLKFKKVVIPQIIETVVFNVIVVYLAWNGWGIRSYIVAVLARAVSGTIAIYVLVPYRPKIIFSLTSVKSLLSFGIPYQLNSFIAVLKDRFSILIVSKIIGLEAMGILGWAEKWANLPLRYFLDASNKVTFPLFSRLQSDKQKVKKALESALYFISVLVLPMLAGAYLIMPRIVEIIPKYGKWAPGLTTFNLFLISAAVASVSTFLSNMLTAIGKVKQVLGLMVMWTVLTLTLYPILATKYGHFGVALASVLVSCSSIVAYILARRAIKFDLIKKVGPSLLSSLLMLVIVNFFKNVFSQNIIGLIEIVITGGLVYGLILFIIDGNNLKNNIQTFLKYAKK